MNNLGKREMIMLSIAMVIALIAAVDYFKPKKKNPMIDATQKTEELNTFVSDLTARMGDTANTAKGVSAVILTLAEKEWTHDPFMDSKLFKMWNQSKEAADKEGSGPSQKVEFAYNGYFETGGKRMAIINDFEYTEGESLETKGYFLKKVSETLVIIENRNTKTMMHVSLPE